jgi:hypothetical protein
VKKLRSCLEALWPPHGGLIRYYLATHRKITAIFPIFLFLRARSSPGLLLTHSGGVRQDVGHTAVLLVLVPGPNDLPPIGLAALQLLGQTGADVLTGALDGGLA